MVRNPKLARNAILHGALLPWMKALAEWHATQPGTPKKAQVLAIAMKLSGQALTPDTLALLLSRDDWMAYREEMALDELARARRRLEHRLDEYMDAHLWALQSAKKEGDYKAVAMIADPVMDRAWPKRDVGSQTAQTIIVNLPGTTPAEAHVIEPLPDVEVVTVEKPTP